MTDDMPETPEEVADITGGDPDRMRRAAQRMLDNSSSE
jgi:hypothetical protein